MTDAYDTLREMLKNVPDHAQVYVEELESIVEWPGITAGTFRQLLACFEGFEAMWEAREKAHDAEVATLTAQLAEARESKLGIAQEALRADNEWRKVEASLRAQLATAKREALVPCRECAGSGLVPATPLPAPDHEEAREYAAFVLKSHDLVCAVPSGRYNLAHAYLALAPHGEAVARTGGTE
jgi:hypothetical protein